MDWNVLRKPPQSHILNVHINQINLKENLLNFVKHLLWGVMIILGGLFLYMTLIQAIGYLPYSDRPGSGWYKDEFSLTWNEIEYIWGFIWFLGIYISVELIIVYFLFRLFRLIGYNRVVFAILGGLIIGFLSLYTTFGIGWYIAIDSSSVICSGILGIIYGSTLFPTYIKPIKKEEISN